MKKQLLFIVFLLIPLTNHAQNLVNVSAYTLKKQTGYNRVRTFSGQVLKQSDANLSFEFPGKVIQIYFDQGQQVQEGDLIAKQDTQLLVVEEQKSNAQKQRVEAELALVKLEQKRISDLYKKNFSSTSSFDEINTRIAIISAELAEIIANMNEIMIRKKKAHLFAPFSGTLGERFISKGENVNSGDLIVRLIENLNTQVNIGIPQKLKNSIKDTVNISISGQNFIAQTLSKGSSIDPTTQTLTMRFSLPDSVSVYPGQLAKLTIPQHISRFGFWVPLDALADGIRGTWKVYLIKNNILKSITVQLFYTHNGYAFIGAPLQDKDKIIANGMHKLSANIAVNIVENQPTKDL